MIVHVDGEYSHIECEVQGCHEKSPPAAVLLESHGLAALGWFIAPGHHRCPKHFAEPTVAQGPQRRTAKEQAAIERKAKK